MNNLSKELLDIAGELESISSAYDRSDCPALLAGLVEAATEVGRAWSGSWMGYHAYVYYKDFQRPPPGAHFSPEWGFKDSYFFRDTVGNWEEYNPEEVKKAIYNLAGNPVLDKAREEADNAKKAVENRKSDVLSSLAVALQHTDNDDYLAGLKDDIAKIKISDYRNFIRALRPSGQIMSRDSLALTQGFRDPPHNLVLADVGAIRHPLQICQELAHMAKKSSSHLARLEQGKQSAQVAGTRVFIGHGRSPLWRELKDFIEGRLHLPCDEFNRIPVAGTTNIDRLSEMLDASAMAFLVMTGEDEKSDSELHARMNVVHEAGLFQGRLGFNRAIILLEEACEEFSNIHGLGQIRFPAGNIGATFEEIRAVLEREGILDPQR